MNYLGNADSDDSRDEESDVQKIPGCLNEIRIFPERTNWLWNNIHEDCVVVDNWNLAVLVS